MSTAPPRARTGSGRSIPRYVEVSRDLSRSIAAGRIPVGATLPSEASLCHRYRISRFTAREALRQLAEAGLIERSRGRESRVVARRAAHAFVFSAQGLDDVLRYAAATTLELEGSDGPAEPETAARLGLGDARRWRRLSGLRRDSSEAPIGRVEVHLRRDLCSSVALGPRISSAIFAQVVEHEGLFMSHIDQAVTATTVPGPLADALGCAAGEPALEIERRFTAKGVGLFEVSVSLHPAGAFHYSFRLTSSGPRW